MRIISGIVHKKALLPLLFYYILLFYVTIRLSSPRFDDYFGNKMPDIEAQLVSIDLSLKDGGGEKMQSIHPEGYFLSFALYGLALINQADATDNLVIKQRNITRLGWINEKLRTEITKTHFSDDQKFVGAFHLGWFNRLNAGLIRLSQGRNKSSVTEFHNRSYELAESILTSPTHNIDSYPGMCWPVDNVVAISSLLLHDEMFSTNYKKAVMAWLDYTRTHLDPKSEMIPHQIDSKTGHIVQGARGSSTALTLAFLPEIDSDFAMIQYRAFIYNFQKNICGYGLLREYPNGVRGSADVDSGPLVFGISPVATLVSLAAAKANGDQDQFGSVLSLSELFRIPINDAQKKEYFLGKFVAAEGFLAWGETLKPVRKLDDSKGVRKGTCIFLFATIPLIIFLIVQRKR